MKVYIMSLLVALAGTGAMAQPMTLAECRRMALEHNESVRAAGNAVKQAEYDRQIAYANYLPKVDGSLMGVYMKDLDMGGSTIRNRGTWLAGINVTQPVYAGGRITAGNRLARIGKEISVEKLRQARQQTIADVDNAYYTLIAVRAKVDMLEALAEQMRSLYESAALGVKAEMSTRNELLRISAKQSDIEYQLQKARNGETICRLSLAGIIGLPLDDADITPADTAIVVQAPAALDEDIGNRPEMNILRKQVDAGIQEAKMERAGYLPTVGLSLGYSYFDNMKMKGSTQLPDGSFAGYTQNIKEDIPMVMLSVQIPLFHWGAELKKARKARLDVENARLQLQQNERAMRIEVRQAVQNVTDGYRMVETARRGQEEADENLRVMRQKYDVRMATMTDLLEAQSQWQQAHSNYIESLTQYKIYETEYLRVKGCLE